MIVFRCYYYEIRYDGNQWSQPNSIHFHPLIISHTYTHTLLSTPENHWHHTHLRHHVTVFAGPDFFLFLSSMVFGWIFSFPPLVFQIRVLHWNMWAQRTQGRQHTHYTAKMHRNRHQTKAKVNIKWHKFGLVYDLCIKPWLRITCR